MTVKEAITRVCDDAAGFPKGWNTQVAEVIRRTGGLCFERRQRFVWMLRTATPHNGEGDKVTLWRRRERALAEMEDGIREALAAFGGEAELVRDDEEHAHLSNLVEWSVTREFLHP